MMTLLMLASLAVNRVDVVWVCAGNSYMALEPRSIDFRNCEGWVMVDGEPVRPLLEAPAPLECDW